MIQVLSSNPYHIQASATNFRKDNQGEYQPPDVIFVPKPGDGNHYPIRVLLIGIPDGVDSVIKELYLCKFAQVQDWSPAMKARHIGEIMRVTTKYFVINS